MFVYALFWKCLSLVYCYTLHGAGMVNNDDDGLWGLLKINMNMRVYRERQRQRRDKERNIF